MILICVEGWHCVVFILDVHRCKEITDKLGNFVVFGGGSAVKFYKLGYTNPSLLFTTHITVNLFWAISEFDYNLVFVILMSLLCEIAGKCPLVRNAK